MLFHLTQHTIFSLETNFHISALQKETLESTGSNTETSPSKTLEGQEWPGDKGSPQARGQWLLPQGPHKL